MYRAPRSRSQMNRYWWFCLEHVRLYNAAWNYYAGMSDGEVEADIRFDTVWQRPTWRLGDGREGQGWRRPRPAGGFGDFGVFDDEQKAPPRYEPAGPEQHALQVLGLQPPVTVAIVKARYKLLVKRHHPDANGGDKACEERFKAISEAYRTVMSSLGA
ncbi:MAG: J domain-containing protein [Defluviicoccus sp.]|nr:MAG: J domain-containing protein [Defluviicoccus sp.]